MEQPIPAPHRPLVMGTQQAVSTGHYLATLAAMRVLDRGGNAVDAGVAAGLCLGVLYPDMVSVAGVAPIIFYHAERQEVTTISGLGRWPRRASADYFQEHCGGKIPHGILRTVIPAAPDAWITALERYGTMGFGDVAESAMALCEDGYPAHRLMCEIIAEHASEYAEWESSAAIFLARGRPPRQGEIFYQKDLGRTLRLMVAAEHARRFAGRGAALNAAREAFYQGEIADTLVRYHETHGGWLTHRDLAEFRVQVEPPVSTRFHGYEVYACGPWCQGPVLPQVLNLLEGIDPTAMRHNSSQYIHLLVEALKLVYADRERYYGDPEFVDVPIDGLLSKVYAKDRARRSIPRRPTLRCRPTGIPGPIATSHAPGKPPLNHLSPRSMRALSRWTPVISAWWTAMGTSFPPPRATVRRVLRSFPDSASSPLHGGRNPGPTPAMRARSNPGNGRGLPPIRRWCSRTANPSWPSAHPEAMFNVRRCCRPF